MKKTQQLLVLLACAFFIASCCPPHATNCSADEKIMQSHKGNGHRNGDGSQFIPVDSANKMIGSYLQSVNAFATDSALDCIIIDADMLRAYLDDSCNGKISSVKLMFAHTLEYINNGNGGVYCGYQPNALTLIIAGYDIQGNYIMANGNSLLDNGVPCPSLCPKSGSASNNMVVTNQKKK